MAWAWRHTSDGLAAYWVAEKLQPHSQEQRLRVLWPSAVWRQAFHYPIALKPGCRRIHRGTQEWLFYTGIGTILIRGKNPKYCITASSGGFEYGTTVVW